MVNYEPIYDINGTWAVHFNFPKMIDQKLLDQCDGNQHNCKHLKMQYLASLSEEERKKYLDRNG